MVAAARPPGPERHVPAAEVRSRPPAPPVVVATVLSRAAGFPVEREAGWEVPRPWSRARKRLRPRPQGAAAPVAVRSGSAAAESAAPGKPHVLQPTNRAAI